jgi:Tol biopolymer transport system component
MNSPPGSRSRVIVLCIVGCITCIPRSPAQTCIAVSALPGSTAGGESVLVAISGDGRWTAFQSAASDLVAGDSNGREDVFLRDLWSSAFVLASVSSAGGQGNDASRQPSTSNDGRYVVFQSFASNLVDGDTNGASDIFLRDVASGTTTRISVRSDGSQSEGLCRYPFVSRDGRYTAFESSASDLVDGDDNGTKDIFLHDRIARTTVRASVAEDGGSPNGECFSPAISPDGRYVAFSSAASNLVPGDANGEVDVFLRDLLLAQTELVSRPASGGADGSSFQPSLSDGARLVAFTSQAANLVAGDDNGFADVFVKNRIDGSLTLASVSTLGASTDWDVYGTRITANGRFVAFYSNASTLVPPDGNWRADAFVRDLELGVTIRASETEFGTLPTADVFYPTLSDDGRYVAFQTSAANMVPGDPNGTSDVFVSDLAGNFRGFCTASVLGPLDCPCANNGALGHGCDNSAGGGGARLIGLGSTGAGVVSLVASHLEGSFAVVLQGHASLGRSAFGDGVVCLGAPLLRLYTTAVVASIAIVPGEGDQPVLARSAALGDPISTGDIRTYQVLYRDSSPAFCTSEAWNLTNAVRVDW